MFNVIIELLFIYISILLPVILFMKWQDKQIKKEIEERIDIIRGI